jgi:hypothetical protein
LVGRSRSSFGPQWHEIEFLMAHPDKDSAPLEIFWNKEWIPVTNWGTDEHQVGDERSDVDPLDITVCVAYDARLEPNAWGVFTINDSPQALLSIRKRKPR